MGTKKVALLTLHGMGEQHEGYSRDLEKMLRKRLKNKADDLAFIETYYQNIMQGNEERVWGEAKKKILHWDDLRRFVLYGFGDAAGLEHGKEAPNSAYSQTQLRIAKKMLEAYAQTNGGPVFFIAQSLGCQVLSCYLYDAQQAHGAGKIKVGLWSDLAYYQPQLKPGGTLEEAEIQYLQGSNVRRIVTTGCNIPIFVAAHEEEKIVAIKPTHADFAWHNFYDPDDALGWPLAPLSGSYRERVTDHRINASDGFLGFMKSWTPMSHGAYWGDDDVLDMLTTEIKRYL